jgi:putative oxidoreductase
MVKSLLIAVNKKLAHDDLGKLLLRLAVGGLMLFHGLHKLFGGVGSSADAGGKRVTGVYRLRRVDWRSGGPCLIVLGLYASGGAGAGVYDGGGVADGGNGQTFALDAVGAWAIESLVYFFIGALARAF